MGFYRAYVRVIEGLLQVPAFSSPSGFHYSLFRRVFFAKGFGLGFKISLCTLCWVAVKELNPSYHIMGM